MTLKVKQEFHIGEHITLKLEDTNPNSYRDWTVVYVDGEEFIQCHFLLITVSKDANPSLNNMDSIDEIEGYLSRTHERNPTTLTPEEEFFGHCSNIQVWYEHNYDTRLLHRNIAFPLLEKLTKAGDPKANRVFKEEIAKRISSGNDVVIKFLLTEGFGNYLDTEEFRAIHQELEVEGKKLLEENIIEVLETEGTKPQTKKRLFSFLESIDKTSNLKYITLSFNDEKFFVKINQLNIYDHWEPDNWDRDLESIEDLIGLNKLTDLKVLNLNNFKIDEISGLETLINLEELHLRGNNIKEIKGLDKLTKLRVLNLEKNMIKEIKGLQVLINLKVLNLKHNKLKEIKGLKSLINLESLNISRNEITEIKGLDTLAKLKQLYLAINNIKEIKGLDNLTNLKHLYLIYNKIGEIKGLEQLEKLEVLNLEHNRIRKIKNISHLINLKELQLVNNPIPEHDFENIKWKNRKLGYV